jgi:hypothetical protein
MGRGWATRGGQKPTTPRAGLMRGRGGGECSPQRRISGAQGSLACRTAEQQQSSDSLSTPLGKEGQEGEGQEECVTRPAPGIELRQAPASWLDEGGKT